MKANRLYAVILSLSLPLSAFAIGMGDIKVLSSLNQPFNAEIPIMDMDGISLESIKANLAPLEDYERIGLQQSEILSFLKFSVQKNQQGQPVISIRSDERIPDPYLQILVDLAWANGQIYRAYTILLDPPGYQVAKVTPVTQIKNINKVGLGEPGVVDKPVYQHMSGSLKQSKSEVMYGPTVANEDVWQIAQRYTTSEITLQQVILAIVGTNSEAFTQGNLNGLKIGENLRIPSMEEIAKIPPKLAKEEVLAHDIAWENKHEIKHVILPPYIDAVTGTSQFNKIDTTYYLSQIAPIPKFNLEKPAATVVPSLPEPEVFFTPSHTLTSFSQNQLGQVSKQKDDINLRAKMGVTLAAIDSVRTDNALMKEQLNKLKAVNMQLQQQFAKQNQELNALQQQLKVLMQERQGLHAQVSTVNHSDSASPYNWLYWLIIGDTTVLAAYGLLYWLRQRQVDEENILHSTGESNNKNASFASEKEKIASIEPTETMISPSEEKGKNEMDVEVLPSSTQSSSELEINDMLAQTNEERSDKISSEKNLSELNANGHESIKTTSDDSPDTVNHPLDFEPGLDKLITPKPKPDIHDELSLDFTREDQSGQLKQNQLNDFIPKHPNLDKNHATQEPLLIVDSDLEPLEFSGSELDANLDNSAKLDNQEELDSQSDLKIKPEESTKATLEDISKQPGEPESQLVKSSVALDTLLSLAKTYITMEDFESAQQSLQEVLAFGNVQQKEEAKKILEELNKQR